MWTTVDNSLASLGQRFWSKVDQTGEHWIGPRQYEFQGIVQPSRRWAWMLDRGTFLLDGQEVEPCPVTKSCLNPAHLATKSEVLQRGAGYNPFDLMKDAAQNAGRTADLASITNAPGGKKRGEW